MAAVTGELAASYRDQRIADGKANNTVRIELAMLSNLFTIAIQEWGDCPTIREVTYLVTDRFTIWSKWGIWFPWHGKAMIVD